MASCAGADGVLVTFPARGTWIEIRPQQGNELLIPDVPRKGNVDRNANLAVERRQAAGRSPQGERG